MQPHTFRTKLVLLPTVVAMPFIFSACDIASPELPSFTTLFTLPIERQEVFMEELVEEDGILGIDGDGELFISMDGDTLSVELDQDLAVDVEARDLSMELGNIEIEAGEPVSRDFALVDLYPAAGELPPGTVPVPPFQFDLSPEPQDIEDVLFAHLVEGSLRVTLSNDLQVPISGTEAPELIHCDLSDSYSGELIETVPFVGEIAPGGQAVVVMDMAGKTLPDSVALRIRGGSPGHEGVEDVDPYREISLRAEFLDLSVDQALAVVGSQSLEELRSVELGDSLFIQEALVESGALLLDLENETPLPCTATLAFDEVYDAGGAPLVRQLELAPESTGQLEIDLAGAEIRAPGAELLPELGYRVTVESPGSGEQAVALNSTLGFRSVMPASELRMAECTGVFPEKTFELDPVSEELDLPEELVGVNFTAASLTIDVYNETGVPGELDILLEASKPDGTTTSLEHSARIEPAGGERPAMLTKIVLDEGNSNIVELLSGAPERIDMSASVRVGGPDLPGTARPGQSATVLWSVEAPLRATVEATEILKDPFELDLEDDTRDTIRDHLYSAQLLAEVDNSLPLDLELRFLVGPDSATVHHAPERVIGPFTVAAAPAGGEGYSTESNLQWRELQLSYEDVLAMTEEGHFMALQVDIPGTDGEEIALRSSDGLIMRGALEVEVNTKD